MRDFGLPFVQPLVPVLFRRRVRCEIVFVLLFLHIIADVAAEGSAFIASVESTDVWSYVTADGVAFTRPKQDAIIAAFDSTDVWSFVTADCDAFTRPKQEALIAAFESTDVWSYVTADGDAFTRPKQNAIIAAF